MKKYPVVMAFVLFLFIVSFVILLFQEEGARACFGENCFDLEIASTPQDLSYGLMFREELDPDGGMLFIFPEEAQQLFWMKNMLIALDIVWVNKDLEVVYILQDAPPCSEDTCPVYGPEEPTLYVIELPAGTASRINLKVFDKVWFEGI